MKMKTQKRQSVKEKPQQAYTDDHSDFSGIKIPEIPRTDSQLKLLKQALQQNCTKGEAINPAMALNFLNMAQVHQDPEAYEPEITVQHRKKQ